METSYVLKIQTISPSKLTSEILIKKEVLAEVCNPIFVDPNGDKLRE